MSEPDSSVAELTEAELGALEKSVYCPGCGYGQGTWTPLDVVGTDRSIQ